MPHWRLFSVTINHQLHKAIAQRLVDRNHLLPRVCDLAAHEIPTMKLFSRTPADNATQHTRTCTWQQALDQHTSPQIQRRSWERLHSTTSSTRPDCAQGGAQRLRRSNFCTTYRCAVSGLRDANAACQEAARTRMIGQLSGRLRSQLVISTAGPRQEAP